MEGNNNGEEGYESEEATTHIPHLRRSPEHTLLGNKFRQVRLLWSSILSTIVGGPCSQRGPGHMGLAPS